VVTNALSRKNKAFISGLLVLSELNMLLDVTSGGILLATLVL
jgi:hypothetical protein